MNQKYALLSVYDKTGIIELATTLAGLGYKIISTGGTATVLAEAGVDIIPIQDITGNPESFDGRMKTISFQIESGILFDRTNTEHVRQAEELKIKPIDIVVCNLYPFENKPGIENIDVGGPTMVRAAAKNFKNVLVVVDPKDYEKIGSMLKAGEVTQDQRKALAAKAFAHLSFYDSQIARFLSAEKFPTEVTIPGRKAFDLRYAENPHQKGAVYSIPGISAPMQNLQQRSGRGLSLTNVTDINAGLEVVRLFNEPAAVVIKHNNPCGIALGATTAEALARAIEADAESAFGGVIVLNKSMDAATAGIISQFKDERRGNIDIVAVPEIAEEVVKSLTAVRKTMGIYSFGAIPPTPEDRINFKWIDGGFILQENDDNLEAGFSKWTVATEKQPTDQQLKQMQLAWEFITRIRSNAIIVVDKDLPMTRGIGTGQTSRVRSVRLALEQAGDKAKGAILASDSFFPFDDSVKLAAQYGVAAIVQQGESINDKASIAAADAGGIAMVFTHRRAFWH
jgi:phosphoribosylaminoimidazolecarboxamide formyltransferase/IMP cyclohydrolase